MKLAKHEHRDWLKLYGAAALMTVLGFFVAYQFVDPAPPSRVTIATGSENGAYYAYAQRYRKFLGEHGIELEVRATAGSVENIQLLKSDSGAIDVAFVQGGAAGKPPATGLMALGSLYFEPLWIFRHTPGHDSASGSRRSRNKPGRLRELAGKRLAVGSQGSGTRAVAVPLLAANGLIGSDSNARSQTGLALVELVELGGKEAVQALREGSVDAVFLVASVTSPAVDELLRAPGITPLGFERAAAYERRFRYLSRVTLPEGVIDLESNVPANDVVMLAPAATLVAVEGLHPAIVDLLLQAADKVHGGGGIFEIQGQFPSANLVEYPLSADAQRFYKSGPPFLQRFLPFWAATLIDRMLVLLLPLAALLLPLIRIMPPLYRWRVRSRVTRWYRELLAIDPGSITDNEGAQAARLAELDRLEDEVAKVEVPASFADQLYHLKAHIKLVRLQVHNADLAVENERPSE